MYIDFFFRWCFCFAPEPAPLYWYCESTSGREKRGTNGSEE